LRFARAVEPENQALQDYEQKCVAWRKQDRMTLPSSMELERRINPFLRSREPSVRRAAQSFAPAARSDADCFGALREWKNQFK